MTDAGGDGSPPRSGSDDTRLAALEVELEALRGELAELRGRMRRMEAPEPRERPAPSPRDASPHFPDATTDARARPHASLTDRLAATDRPGLHRSSLTGDAVESWVGRYGTLIAGACVILLGVGTLV